MSENKSKTKAPAPKTRPNQEMNAYFKASKSYKNQRDLLAVITIIFAIGIVGLVYLNSSTIYVSVPGQTFQASRAFTNPYLEIDAEQTMIEFCNYMHSFDADTYKEDLDRAKTLSSDVVYDEIYNAYYETLQSNGNPAYANWIQNGIAVRLYQDSVKSYYAEGKLITEWHGKQIYQKESNPSENDVIDVAYQAIITPMQSKTSKNRLGLKVTQFAVLKSQQL